MIKYEYGKGSLQELILEVLLFWFTWLETVFFMMYKKWSIL
jgi:hypothetical protein